MRGAPPPRRARRCAARPATAERGAGSVIVLAIIGSVLALTAGLLPVLILFVHSQRAANAADAAALAAADALTGAVVGSPCDLAASVAQRNGARLISCANTGPETSVTVAMRILAFELTATARAGPAPEPGRARAPPRRARRRAHQPLGPRSGTCRAKRPVRAQESPMRSPGPHVL